MLPQTWTRQFVDHKGYKTSQGRPHKFSPAIICGRQPVESIPRIDAHFSQPPASHYPPPHPPNYPPTSIPRACALSGCGSALSSNGPTRSQSSDRRLWRARTCGRAAAGKRHILTAYDIRYDGACPPKKKKKKKKKLLIMTWFDPTETWSILHVV